MKGKSYQIYVLICYFHNNTEMFSQKTLSKCYEFNRKNLIIKDFESRFVLEWYR
jgi:hypothetical protein